MWRYSAAYPLKKEDVKISFNEVLSPHTAIDYRGFRILVKQDNLLPTGSFKDRGAAMVINFLNKHGDTTITEDSSGNGGAAVTVNFPGPTNIQSFHAQFQQGEIKHGNKRYLGTEIQGLGRERPKAS